MARTLDEVKTLLAEKFSLEKKRLKSYGTKTDSYQMANVTAQYVLALMSESRYRELKKLDKLLDTLGEDDNEKVVKHIQERLKATKAMAKAIENVAVENEKKRPWKRKEKKYKPHRKHK
jgi:hypothetical protein